MIKSRFLGGVFLVCGTTIGAAILALPTTTGLMGFFPSIPLFVVCYFIMLATAFLFLDVIVSIPGEVNLVSMAKETLGKPGQVLCWTAYLLLLYSVEAAYIDGSVPLLQDSLRTYLPSLTLDRHWFYLGLPLIVISFLYIGTKGIDFINRIMVLGLFAAYFVLLLFLPQHIDVRNLTHVDFKPTILAFPVVAVAFGYHIVIPSLVSYCKKDLTLLKKIIVIGSFIPLVINLVFQFLSLGVLPLKGNISLSQSFFEQKAVTEALALITSQPQIILAAKFFSFFAIITSFLGVTLSLKDFLVDGLKLNKSPSSTFISLSLTLLPPLAFLYVMGKSFIIALQFAGSFIAILLIFLPAAMAWNLKNHLFYQSLKGRVFLGLLMVIGIVIAFLGFLQGFGKLDFLVAHYKI